MFQEFIELDHGRMGLVIGLIAILGAMTTVLLSIIAVQWRKSHESEINAQLKVQLLEMGLKPEEIVLILEAGRKRPRRDARSLVQEWQQRLKERIPTQHH